MGFWPRGPLCLAAAAPPGQCGAERRPGRKSTNYKLSPGRRGPGRAYGIHAGSLLTVAGEVMPFPSPAFLAGLTLPRSGLQVPTDTPGPAPAPAKFTPGDDGIGLKRRCPGHPHRSRCWSAVPQRRLQNSPAAGHTSPGDGGTGSAAALREKAPAERGRF